MFNLRNLYTSASMSIKANYDYDKQITINDCSNDCCRKTRRNIFQNCQNVVIVDKALDIVISRSNNKKNKCLRPQRLHYRVLKTTTTEAETSIGKSVVLHRHQFVKEEVEKETPFPNVNLKNINITTFSSPSSSFEVATFNCACDFETINLSSLLYTPTSIRKCQAQQTPIYTQETSSTITKMSSSLSMLPTTREVLPSICDNRKHDSFKDQQHKQQQRKRSIYAAAQQQKYYGELSTTATISYMACLGKDVSLLMQNRLLHIFILLLSLSTRLPFSNALLVAEPTFVGLSDSHLMSDNDNVVIYNSSSSSSTSSASSPLRSGLTGGGGSGSSTLLGVGGGSSGTSVGSAPLVAGGYLDKLDNLERSVAAVLIKVAYGTSTTKRSIPDNSYVPSLTTIATPLLTTLRYLDKSPHQQQINLHHRNYELDLERDHALPTSAPNADILKSNSNPTYPNPNRHHNHDRERHRHLLNSTPLPSLPNILKKNNGQSPTIPMYPGDIPAYSPPARSFFTPPLPPEYQNPFADKPTLRGTNNEAVIANTGAYINRRPIPPPSLMPGHERIPFRPPDLAASTGGGLVPHQSGGGNFASNNPIIPSSGTSTEAERKKALNTPSRGGNSAVASAAGILPNNENKGYYDINSGGGKESSGIIENQQQQLSSAQSQQQHNTRKEVLPSIRRILSGANGNKGEVPEVLLKQVTTRPLNYHQPPASPVVLVDSSGTSQQQQQSVEVGEDSSAGYSASSNINKSKNGAGEGTEHNTGGDTLNGGAAGETIPSQPKTKMSTKSMEHPNGDVQQQQHIVTGFNADTGAVSSTPSAAAAIGDAAAAAATSTTSTTSNGAGDNNSKQRPTLSSAPASSSSSSSSSTTASSAAGAAAAAHATWSIAWNIHVYLSVILFTILAVYSFYKMLTYNKLTHLFSQSYFVCIHLILIIICAARIFYLCYDAYNIHASFHLFISELLLNLPATFLTISFSVLILFLFLKSLNHKNNRYSALIRPLTVVVGCGVHVVLCITLHYVESYTMQNHQQQHLYYHQQQQQQQQQQQLQLYRRQQQLQQQAAMTMPSSAAAHQQYASSANLLAPLGGGLNQQTAIAGMAAAAAAAASVSTSPPPRVLSLICQIIYIFICLSLGLLYLYLYRILKRILRSKSQNYIHGYQNLSYAIHITIATALLFVLLAVLQIFGAISISTTRTLMTQTAGAATAGISVEIDWLQWGYQFSLRLIEIAIITLISWVAGLKTSGGGGGVGSGAGGINIGNGDTRLTGHAAGSGGGGIFGSATASGVREKHHNHHHHHNHHSNVAGFFLPCTSSSSQEQFDTDYPAVCNANTNLHTYTMRTGKLIYDDSFALNSLASGGGGSGAVRNAEFQLQQQPAYQRPYDTGSQHSSSATNNTVGHHIVGDYGTHAAAGSRYHHQHDIHQYADYMTDATTDHYENPNFDLRGPSSSLSVANSSLQKFASAKTTSTTSTTASSSAGGGGGGSGTSSASQQQMLLLPSDSCYSEPLQQNCTNAAATNYDFNNFERPKFGGGGAQQQSALECWSDVEPTLQQPMLMTRDKRDKKHNGGGTTLERAAYENPERRSSNSTHSCVSSSGAGGRYASYNSFERGHYNGVRKSGTLNNIVGGGGIAGGIMHGRNASSSSAASSNVSMAAVAHRASGAQTLAATERGHHHQQQNSQRGGGGSGRGGGLLGGSAGVARDHDIIFGRSSLERTSSHMLQHQQQQKLHQLQRQQQQRNSDDDMVLSGSNVERTNLINNDGSCITGISGGDSSNSTATSVGNLTDQGICSGNSNNNSERLLSNKSGASAATENVLPSNNSNSSCSTSHSLMQSNQMPNPQPQQLHHHHSQHHPLSHHNSHLNNHLANNCSGLDSASASASATSSTSGTSPSSDVGGGGGGSMLVAELGFVRFRALDDINNAQGVGIHNASIRAQDRGAVAINSSSTASAAASA